MWPYRKTHEEALQAIGRNMGGLTVESLEAERWLAHLRAVVASGRGVVLDVNDPPAAVAEAQRQNKLIGYSDAAGVYVIAENALAAMKGLADRDVINGISANALGKQLIEIGAIVRKGADKNSVVKRINGQNIRVLHLRADILTEVETP